MRQLAPLTIAVPLLGAALLIVVHPLLHRIASDAIAVAVAAASTVMTVLLLVHVGHGLIIYWFGGWHPRAGVAIGIDLAVDPLGAGLAVFVSLLMVLALVFSAVHIDVEHPYYHVLMLTFMAGMVGFCLSGDLFNLFVMFEVMSVSAVALVAYKIREQAALEGGLNFAVINTIGAFLFLLGIAFIYGETGALNLAQIGRALSHGGQDRVVVLAFTLIVCALLVKAAIVPFHFWLADAYAVALTPVCILLAGAMSEMGIFGVARVWFTAFEPGLHGHVAVLRAIFVGAGLLTSLWGAIMALVEDHLKRMLAFVTVSFVGIYLAGAGLLSEDGIAGAGVYVLADGFVKALLFACVGIVQSRIGRVGQARLHGRARHLRFVAFAFVAGGLLMSSLPPFGPFLGKAMVDDAAVKAGYGFMPAIIMVASGLCAAAVLRAAGRVFLGWGSPGTESADHSDADTEPESERLLDRTPAVMVVPLLALLAGGIALGVWPGFADLAAQAAHRFVDATGYAGAVYGTASRIGSVTSHAPEWFDYLYGAGGVALAVAVASADLTAGRSGWWDRVRAGASWLLAPIRELHTGRIGDYTAALTLGVGVFGALIAVTLL